MSIVVAAVLHDPNLIVHQRFAAMAHNYSLFHENFFMVISQQTNAFPYRLHIPESDAVIMQIGKGIADARRECLKQFLSSRDYYTHILIVDFDRLLYWLEHDEDSLIDILKSRPYPFTAIGRTELAMQSHPEAQRSTERAINAYTFHRLFEGEPVQDIVAGGYLMDGTAAELIVENSFAIHPGAVDVEWYAIARYTIPATYANHIRVDGLGYEGAWLGLEPPLGKGTPTEMQEINCKRQTNLENAKMMVNTIRAWRHLS